MTSQSKTTVTLNAPRDMVENAVVAFLAGDTAAGGFLADLVVGAVAKTEPSTDDPDQIGMFDD